MPVSKFGPWQRDLLEPKLSVPHSENTMQSSKFPRFRASGDTGLTVELGDRVDQETSARVLSLRQAIESRGLAGVVEVVPAYLSLLVHYTPLETSQSCLIEDIRALADSLKGGAAAIDARSWVLPVCFDDPEFAPDLEHVASWAGLKPSDVIADMISVEQTVYMLGFAPGQPYLGDLPDRLAIPRRMDPITGVPAGSVLIATGKTVIYPVQNPTGWYIVGKTPIPVFSPASATPVLLQPGDKVRLRSVGKAEYQDIADRLRNGETVPGLRAHA